MNTKESVNNLLRKTVSTWGGEISRKAACKYKLAGFFHIGILKRKALKEKTEGLMSQNYPLGSKRGF